eukprot:XP_006523258.1 PREDICTED: uncharacterized protein LOC102641028 [Mus musculus]
MRTLGGKSEHLSSGTGKRRRGRGGYLEANVSGTRCCANGKPGFAGDRELGIQIAGADGRLAARPRRKGSFAQCASPRAARRGRQGAQRDLSAITLRSGQPRSGLLGKRGAAAAGVGDSPAGWSRRPAGWLAGAGVSSQHCSVSTGPQPTRLRVGLRRRRRGFRWVLIRGPLVHHHCACVQSRDRNSLGSASRPPERKKQLRRLKKEKKKKIQKP